MFQHILGLIDNVCSLVVSMLKIVDSRIEEFNIPLGQDSPLVVATGGSTRIFTDRRGAYIRLTCASESNEKIIHATGELVEPVFCATTEIEPGDVLQSSIPLLRSFASILTNETINLCNWRVNLDSILDRMHEHSGEPAQATSIACFAIEQALLVAIAKASERSLVQILREWVFGHAGGYSEPDTVKINSMFNARMDRSVEVAPGCTKIKVGSSNPKADAELLNNLSARSECEIRLDANKMWTVDQACEFFSSLSDDAIQSIEYVEEPVTSGSVDGLVRSLSELHIKCPKSASVPIALDESLMMTGTAELVTHETSLRIIHKTYLHGIRTHRKLLSERPERVTVTCTFETGIGLSFLCCLAAAINPLAYHGIHALGSMKISDLSTKKFSDCMRSTDEGIHVRLADVVELL